MDERLVDNVVGEGWGTQLPIKSGNEFNTSISFPNSIHEVISMIVKL